MTCSLKRIDKALIKKELLFVGFINFEDIGRVDEATCLYYSEKPNFSIDHTVLLNLPKAPKVWNLEDDALIDDNTLLSEDDLKKPSAKDLKLDCGSSVEGTRRRPCKNCTCGLADEFKAKNATFAKSGIVSNCKNCALGDAFRCSNCPYLGMPPFKTDETGRIKLPDVTDT
uniref:Fe-S cluster assembly protein DRE2 n=1 Tax=Syphacia muris TaxID=451379 RepID=A0A0N5AYM2_9BILA